MRLVRSEWVNVWPCCWPLSAAVGGPSFMAACQLLVGLDALDWAKSDHTPPYANCEGDGNRQWV